MAAFKLPEKRQIRWTKHHRIIATKYPPVDLLDRTDMSEAEKRAFFALIGSVNPRLRQEIGALNLVRQGDMVSGPGASYVMAAFTHIGFPSRFSDGTYGIYYAARKQETAIYETAYHRERDAVNHCLGAYEFDMRAWIGALKKPVYDIRLGHNTLHQKNIDSAYPKSQRWANHLLQADPDAWGIVYRSVRKQGGECLAALRPPAVSLPTSGSLLTYVFNGEKITSVYEKKGSVVDFT